MNIDKEKNQYLLEELNEYLKMCAIRSVKISELNYDDSIYKTKKKLTDFMLIELEHFGLPSTLATAKALLDAITNNNADRDVAEFLEKVTGKWFGRGYRMPAGYMPYKKLTQYYSNILRYLVQAKFVKGGLYDTNDGLDCDRADTQVMLHYLTMRNMLKFELPFLILDTDTQDLLDYVDIQPIHFDSIHLPFPATTIVFADDHTLPFYYVGPGLDTTIKIKAITVSKAAILKDGECAAVLNINMMHDHMTNGHAAFNYYVAVDNEGMINTSGVELAADGMAANNGHLIEFVLKLLLIMHHKPECIIQESEPRQLIGVRGGKSYIPKQFILPKMVCKDDKGEVLDESQVVRKKMRRHPVRGHMRNQPHGPRNSLVKEIFIAPYWKCEDNEN